MNEDHIMTKTTKLRALRDKHTLSALQIAELLGVLDQTVRIWLSLDESREIPDTKLALLELLIKES